MLTAVGPIPQPPEDCCKRRSPKTEIHVIPVIHTSRPEVNSSPNSDKVG
ncbi:hypothetical protein Q9233_017242 [Columba guinea]|nr:hypothetical protein Q9233_017242 [Columba guinea]